jgi:hypothetical protein
MITIKLKGPMVIRGLKTVTFINSDPPFINNLSAKLENPSHFNDLGFVRICCTAIWIVKLSARGFG